jgi:hypothetical protein
LRSGIETGDVLGIWELSFSFKALKQGSHSASVFQRFLCVVWSSLRISILGLKDFVSGMRIVNGNVEEALAVVHVSCFWEFA